MNKFKLSMLTLALAAAGTSSIAFAQEAADIQAQEAKDIAVEVISVRGIRGSLQRAQAIKMSETSVVEVISAEDIGKLPDTSIAESISRLPGLTSQRLNGRSNVVAIRGLSEDFSTATYNGREVVSVNDNRGVEFDLFPSEIMNEVVVYKTPDASLTTQGIAGTIDLRSVSPLRHGRTERVVNLRHESNSLGNLNPDIDHKGYRGSFSYIDQFADNTVGVALTVASMSSPAQEERWEAWGYADIDNVKVLGGMKPYIRSAELKRDAIMGVVEFAPTDRLKTTFDVLYVDFKDDQRLRGLEVPLAFGGGWANTGTELGQIEDGFARSGKVLNGAALIRNDANIRDAELISIGQKVEFALDDNWTLTTDFAYSKVSRTDLAFESYAGLGNAENSLRNGGLRSDISFTMLPNNTGVNITPQLNFGDSNLAQLGNPFAWGFDARALLPGQSDANQDGFLKDLNVSDELKSLKFAASRAMDNQLITNVDFGMTYSSREKDRHIQAHFLTIFDPVFAAGNSATVAQQPIPQQYQLGTVSMDFVGLGQLVAYDGLGLYRNGGYWMTDANFVQFDRPQESWTVKEQALAAYAKADFAAELGNVPVSGNFGVQVQQVRQSSDGFAPGLKMETAPYTFAWVPQSGSDDYTRVLPSLNLNFQVADDQMVRFGVARTMAKSRMDRMKASFGTSFDQTKAGSTDINNSPWSGSGGNPNLRPITADAVDLSYDYYFSPQGYVSVASFYRKLNSWQNQEQQLADFSAFDAPPGTVLTQGFVSRWENTKGGYIQGLEVSGVVPFNSIADALDGFGLQFGATFLSSKIEINNQKVDMPGQSKRVYSTSLFYEKSGFQARLSYRYRDDFLAEISGLELNRTSRIALAESLIDAQVGYDFSESSIDWLKGLTVQLQAQNLTNEPFITIDNGDKRQIKDHQLYGRTIMAGVVYRF